MKKAKKLCKVERLEIKILKDKGHSIRSIARAMNRSPNTISQEIRKNSVKGEYVPEKAHHKARVKKKYARFQWKKINENKKLEEYIIERLKKGWNPDEIAGRMRLKKKPFYASKNSIYRWLYTARGAPYCKYLYSKRYTKKSRKKKVKRVMIPNRVGIERRSRGANNRTRYGHTEADTIVSPTSARSTDALSVMVGRKCRYIDARKIPSLKPAEHTAALNNMKQNKKVLSTTFDNGIENRDHEQLGIPTFFCDAYSSWQRGSVENANKMIRRYIPKGTNLKYVSEEKLAWIVERLNNKPRKVLGYRTAREVAIQSGYLVEECPF